MPLGFRGIAVALILIAFAIQKFAEGAEGVDYFRGPKAMGKHFLGAVCLIAAGGIMTDQLRYAFENAVLRNENAGIEAHYLIIMFILGAAGLVWLSQLQYSRNKGNDAINKFAWLPAFLAVSAAGLFTGGACLVG